jgi:acyl carrier protein
VNDAEILRQLQAILGDLFAIPAEEVTPQATVRGTFQLDSMEIITLIEEVELVFHIPRGENSLEAYSRLETVHDLVEHIGQLKRA